MVFKQEVIEKLQRRHYIRDGLFDNNVFRKDLEAIHFDLRGADLHGADLRDAVLHGAFLRGAVLRGADLRDAVLHGAVLRGADLRGADLRDAFLRSADLRNADLVGAKIGGVSGLNERQLQALQLAVLPKKQRRAAAVRMLTERVAKAQRMIETKGKLAKRLAKPLRRKPVRPR